MQGLALSLYCAQKLRERAGHKRRNLREQAMYYIIVRNAAGEAVAAEAVSGNAREVRRLAAMEKAGIAASYGNSWRGNIKHGALFGSNGARIDICGKGRLSHAEQVARNKTRAAIRAANNTTKQRAWRMAKYAAEKYAARYGGNSYHFSNPRIMRDVLTADIHITLHGHTVCIIPITVS